MRRMSESPFDLSPDAIWRLGCMAADAVAEHRATLERRAACANRGACASLLEAPDQDNHCVDKAVDLLGIGMKNLRKIETDERFRIRTDLLREAVAADRRAGLFPAIVVGNAGTVNTGAIDPLEELSDFCRRESLWFHVDGAYGAMVRLSRRLAPLFAGM